MQELEVLFEKYTGNKSVSIEALSPSGSNRQYFRLKSSDGASFIGVKGTSKEENEAFIAISNNFAKNGLHVPMVYAHTEDLMFYLQDDLGDSILFNIIENGRNSGVFSEEEKRLLIETISLLPSLQFDGAKNLDFSVCYPQSEFDKRMIMFDLNYFKYCFLKSTGLEFSETELENDFERMADVLLSDKMQTFLYRDFQSRNVMVHNGKPYFIDFQGGRKGPIYYDVASFLWQAKANFPDTIRDELIGVYLNSLNKYMHVEKPEFIKKLMHFVLFRTLQVLGAYGFRGYIEKKAHFLQSIPFAIKNLSNLIQKEQFNEYPYLVDLLKKMTELEHLNEVVKGNKLHVKVYSFAYKNGLPYDNSGNGGGYVFDCRAIHNPGRYTQYKLLTGMDKEVIDFLETDGEVVSYLENVYALIDAHVERYSKRKFSNLMISFGCTGGQHRSVYCAESVARHLLLKYDVDVTLIHREQRIEKHFN